MYNEGGGAVLGAGGIGAAGALAATGFNFLAYAVVGIMLILLGLVLVRRFSVRLDLDHLERSGHADLAGPGPTSERT
jgi:LPXTG-motif cell wall-anchored protein